MGAVEKSSAGDLDSLAQQINEEHRAFIGSFKNTAEHGIRAGELLGRAKGECQHGTWLSWLEENFEGSVRSAQVYLQMYKNRDAIRAKTQHAAHLSIRGALEEITKPAPKEITEAVREDIKKVAAFTEERRSPKVTKEKAEGPVTWAHNGNPARSYEVRTVDEAQTATDITELPSPWEDSEERRARWRENRREREEREQEASKRSLLRFMEIDNDLTQARLKVKRALENFKGTEFDEESLELLSRQAEAVRGMTGLFIAALTGDSGADWDAEVFELEERRQWGPLGEDPDGEED